MTSFTCSDVDITVNILTGNYQTTTSGLLKNDTRVFRNDGSVTSWAGANFEKFFAYYSVNGSDATGGNLLDAEVIRESRFNAIDNPILYNYYGTYRRYIEAKMTRYPYSKGIIIDSDGKSNTKALMNATFIDHDGSIKPAYPAANYAGSFGVQGAIGFEAGNWWLPSLQELYLIMKNVTYGLAGIGLDQLNTGIEAAGGTKISVSHYIWSSSEYGGYYAFHYYGPYGIMNAIHKFYVYTVRPVSAFQIL